MQLEDLFITEDISVITSMRILDQTSRKILFLVEKNRLLASLTDGDVRRWILKGGSLDASVKEAANYSPIYLKECLQYKALQYIEEYEVEAIPIVNETMHILNIVFNNKEYIGEKKSKLDIPVVIMAGGKGTRLYPYTKILPKPLIPIGDEPILELIMDRFSSYGCKKFHLIVNYKKNMIKAYFSECTKPYIISYEDENKPLGTGGGLCYLKDKIDSTFILTNCDILITEDFSQIYRLHKEKKHLITMICAAQNFKIPYGIVDIDEKGEIISMHEKPELSFFTNTGCYIVESKVIQELEDNQYIGFPDIIEKYHIQGERIGIYPISEDAWMDMGQINELENMQKQLKKQKGKE